MGPGNDAEKYAVSSLTAIFGNSAEKTEDSEKLMDLYWNRAELKKAFADMRKEKYRLLDRVKEQEGQTARIQQRLDHLESLLVDRHWAHNVVVYYQLRGLGHSAERKLARFAEQLKQQREQKSHDSLLANWNEERKEEARAVEDQVLETRDRIQRIENQLQAAQRRLTSMNRMVRLFRGRSSMRQIDAQAAELESAVVEEQALHDQIEEIMNRRPPDHQGLDMAAKRSINLMILAFAQQLYVNLDRAGVAAHAKQATEKSVGAINYGTPHECAELLARISKSVEELEEGAENTGVLRKRVMLLGERARFPGNDDAVPIASTVSTLFSIDVNGGVHEREVDIAGENYWGISRAFSR
jgi:predicted nuclease with TOPRIM domain